jgi:hypothetical protein
MTLLASKPKMEVVFVYTITVIWEWKSIGDRLKGPCYLSRDDHDHKISDRKRRTDIGKYSFVNMTAKLRNQLPAGALAA